MHKHCCQQMSKAVTLDCCVHQDVYECPDGLVSYIPKFNEYGLIIHDGGTASIGIGFCPWCGHSLPKSKRVEWFDTLETLGFDNPGEQDIPEKFTTDAWYKDV